MQTHPLHPHASPLIVELSTESTLIPPPPGGVGKRRDESGRNRDILKLEVMNQQSNGMFEHDHRFGVAQGFAM